MQDPIVCVRVCGITDKISQSDDRVLLGGAGNGLTTLLSTFKFLQILYLYHECIMTPRPNQTRHDVR